MVSADENPVRELCLKIRVTEDERNYLMQTGQLATQENGKRYKGFSTWARDVLFRSAARINPRK